MCEQGSTVLSDRACYSWCVSHPIACEPLLERECPIAYYRPTSFSRKLCPCFYAAEVYHKHAQQVADSTGRSIQHVPADRPHCVYPKCATALIQRSAGACDDYVQQECIQNVQNDASAECYINGERRNKHNSPNHRSSTPHPVSMLLPIGAVLVALLAIL